MNTAAAVRVEVRAEEKAAVNTAAAVRVEVRAVVKAAKAAQPAAKKAAVLSP